MKQAIFLRRLSTLSRTNSLSERPGLGASMIHAHDQLGYKVTVPPFLKTPKTASLIGAPLSWGQPIAGTDQGPKMLREAGLIETLVNLDWRVNERGDLHFDPPNANDPEGDVTQMGGRAKNAQCVGAGLEKIHKAVFESVSNEEFALVLGGDHSIAAGSLAGVLRHRPNTGVIWVDAHADLNSPSSSPSGNLHGMPLAFNLGLVDPLAIPGFSWMKGIPLLPPEQLVFIGLRDVDDGEREVLRRLKIKAFTMQHIDRWGVGGVVEMALDHLAKNAPDGQLPPLHMSYDIDAVDPEVAPSTGTVVRGGLNFREAHYVAEAVAEAGMLGSLDMVEVNPMLKPGKESDLTVQLGMRLIASVMGSRIL